MHFYCVVPWAKLGLKVCGIKVRAKGQEDVNADVPRVYMANHQSYFDILALLAYLPVDFKFVMKQELMNIPILGLAMRKVGFIGIDRDNPRKAIKGMREAAEKIKSGKSLVIFPEGTRSVDGRLQPFKRGGFNLVLKSGCDIVPVAISNSYRILPKGSLRLNKGSFSIHIGKPISVKDYTRKNAPELMDQVRDAMLRQMEKRDKELHL